MNTTLWMSILIVTFLLIGVGRLMITGHGLSLAGSYEAFAHIWVGVVGTISVLYWGSTVGWTCFISLIILSMFETFMFLYGVKTGKFKMIKEN